MGWRVSVSAALTALVVLVASTPGSAYVPAQQTNEMEGYTSSPTLTAKEAAAAAKKIAAFEDFQQARAGSGGIAAMAATAHTVPTYERQQIYSYYCGPAAVQDVADYAWNKGATAHKYSQAYIDDNWTHTTRAARRSSTR